MAFQLPKIDFSDAKTRVIIIFSGILGFFLVVYAVVHLLSSKSTTTGSSHVATAPGNLQSVPGGQLTPEYYRALVQANKQAAKQAQISGGSAVPTLLNEPGAQPSFEQPSTASCTVVCPNEDNVKVENDIDDLVKAGKLSADDGKKLEDLAKRDVSVAEYSAQLDNLVKGGKLTPDQARKLLDDYKKEHENKLIQESGQAMDALIKSGQLPLDVANQLLDLQKNKVTPAEYAARLNELVQEGKISPETAGQLLAQYTQQQAKEVAAEAKGQLDEMAATGQITPEVAKELGDYQNRHVSQKEYEEELQHLVKQGKLTPAQAQRLLAQYKQVIPPEVAQHLGDLQRSNVSVPEYQAELQRLVTAGKISPEQAQALLEQYRQSKAQGARGGAMDEIVKQAEAAVGKVPPNLEEYKRQLNELVKQGKLSLQEMQRLLGEYEKLRALQAEADRLNALRGKASMEEFSDELKRAIAAGLLTAEQAARLLQEYQEGQTHTAVIPQTPIPKVKGAEAFAELQKRVQAATPAAVPPASSAGREQFSAAAAKAKEQANQEQQQRIQTLINGMSQQAGQLISSWQPPTMAGQAGNSDATAEAIKNAKNAATSSTVSVSSGTAGASSTGVPLIKAGTIIYAVLDTAINSDFPDSPVLATLVDGKYKGAKLLGKVGVTQGQDRVTLSFKLMDMDEWSSGKTINAFAIDPDTARTALASNVNYHYFVRYGALFASSFLTGYASAISNSGATTSSGIFGTTTTHPVLSPSSKIMTGLGQVGTTLGTSVQSYTSTPPTVKIDPGTSLGILFMSDVSG